MHRKRAIAIGLAGLAMVAVLLVAGSNDPTATGGSGVPGVGEHGEDGSTGGLPLLDFVEPLLRLFLIGVLALGVLAIVYDLLIGPGRVEYYLLMVGIGAGMLLLLLWILSSREGGSPSRNGSTGAATPTPVNASSGGGSGVPDPSVPPEAAAGIAVLLGGLALAAILFSRGDALLGRFGSGSKRGEPQAELRDLGRVAGAAADRLEADEGTIDNEITRAWRRMVDLLDVDDPRADTPRAFADAATAAGMDTEDVSELTGLFEAVRYGDRPPSTDRRERALAAFRRIERTYGGET